jgi:hypothetical protein
MKNKFERPLICLVPLKKVVLDELESILSQRYNLDLYSEQANQMFWDWYIPNPYLGSKSERQQNLRAKSWLRKQERILNVYLNFIKHD